MEHVIEDSFGGIVAFGADGRIETANAAACRRSGHDRAGRQGRLADYLTRLDLIILDELGYLPFAQTGGQLLFHLVSRLL